MSFYGGVSADQLKQYIERIERLEEEKKNIAEDIRDLFAEAKGNGFDVKTMRQIIKLRKMEHTELEEQEYLLDTYRRALGMLPGLDDEDTPTKAAPAAEVEEAEEATEEAA